MKLKIVVKKISSDVFIASCSTLPGCAIEADSETSAKALLQYAIKAYVLSHTNRNEKLPV